MNGARLMLLPLIIVLAVMRSNAQSGGTVDQVQAVVFGLRSAQQALHVDERLRGTPGVLLSRTDLHTQNLFVLVRHDQELSPATIAQLLSSMGLQVKCCTRSPRGTAPFVPLDPAHCADHPAER